MIATSASRRLEVVRRAWAELRSTLVAMSAVMAAFGTALLIEHLAHLSAEMVVVTVLLTIMLVRAQRDADPRVRLLGLVLIAPASVAAAGLGVLMSGAFSVLGDAMFAVSLAATIYVRRFGPVWTAVGTLVTIPLLATLISPATPTGVDLLWTGLLATTAFVWVTAVQCAATWFRGVARGAASASIRSTVMARRSRMSAPSRLPASTRMAMQAGVALDWPSRPGTSCSTATGRGWC